MNDKKEIAETILAQLGGRRFSAMTGANRFINDNGKLSFRLPGKPGFVKNRISHIVIELKENDLYDITFNKFHPRTGLEKVATAEGVYFDQLQSVFTEQTGLETSL